MNTGTQDVEEIFQKLNSLIQNSPAEQLMSADLREEGFSYLKALAGFYYSNPSKLSSDIVSRLEFYRKHFQQQEDGVLPLELNDLYLKFAYL